MLKAANFAGTMTRAGVNRLRGNEPPSEITEAYRAANELGLTKVANLSLPEKLLLEARVGDDRKLAFFPPEQQPYVLTAARALTGANDFRKKYGSLLTPHASEDYQLYNYGGKRRRKRNRKTNKQKSKKTKTRTRRTRKYRRY